MSKARATPPPNVKAFLSHRYEAGEINLYFYNLLAKTAHMHFNVDEKTLDGKSKPTCVTRLERMTRDANMFVGIFSWDEKKKEQEKDGKAQDGGEHSKYFRLEVDIALRARKPALIFYDQRLASSLSLPSSVYAHPFNAQEVHVPGSPAERAQQRQIEDFFREAHAFGQLEDIQTPKRALAPRKVGILIPPGRTGYGPKAKEAIYSTLKDHQYVPEFIEFGYPFDLHCHEKLHGLDLVVIDIADSPEQAALASFLHGRFIPAIRLVRGLEPACPVLKNALVHAFTAGYPKDILHWTKIPELQAGLKARLELLYHQPRYIGSTGAAEEYFKKTIAPTGPNSVFFSYAGENRDQVQPIVQELKKRVNKVFDYKFPGDIRAGLSWREEISRNLESCDFGILLLSKAYLNSENCVAEAQVMMDLADAGKLKIMPLKLDDAPKTPPLWISRLHIERLSKHTDIPKLVDFIIQNYHSRINES